MRANHIEAVLRRRPFRPVEIRTAGGDLFLVRHPEAIAILNKHLVVLEEPDHTVAWFDTEDVSNIRRRGPRRNGH